MTKKITLGKVLDILNGVDGICLIPGDLRWLKKSLKEVPPELVLTLLNQYKDVWLEHYEREPLEHRKDNAGRFAANTFIRESLYGRSAPVEAVNGPVVIYKKTIGAGGSKSSYLSRWLVVLDGVKMDMIDPVNSTQLEAEQFVYCKFGQERVSVVKEY